MAQSTTCKLEKFRVPEEKALRASLMKYLEGDKYKWLREQWVPKLLEIAGDETPAIGIAMRVVGTLAQLGREASHMKEKPLKRDALDKIYVTRDLELFGLFFESKEVAEKAWMQLPPLTPDRLIRSTDLASAVLAPMPCKVISTTGDSNKAGGPEKELKDKGSSTVDGSSSCGPPWSGPCDQPPSFPSLNSTSFGIVHYSEDEGSSTSSRPKQEGSSTVDGSSSCGPPKSGPSTTPYGQPPSLPSLNNTSFGIVHHSEDEESSTSSRSNHEGPNRVYHFQSFGPPGSDQFPSSSGSLPLVFTHPSACGLPTPFAHPPSSDSPGVTSYADTEQSKDGRSSSSNRSKRPWAKFGLVMDGEPMVDDDGVVFETPGFLNRLAAENNKCDGEEET
ncbi:hypothetical protein MAJ_07901, partial [Metarhizium majus ARSEF 297]